MDPALWIGKTGLDAQQRDISVIANNLANVNTIGFKKSRPVFEDLLYHTVNQPGGASSTDTRLPTGLMIGAGSKVVSTQKIFTEGNVQHTDNAMDMMITGKGFFQILMPDGTISYTRNGQFTMDDQGQLVTNGAGYLLQPNITIPDDALAFNVSQDGEVSVEMPGQADPQVLGQINTVSFINPAGLKPIGENLYLETAVSGAPVEGVPGEQGMGTIQQNMLETSNVNVTEELVNMIQSQRAYETNTKVVSAVDQMLSYINQQL